MAGYTIENLSFSYPQADRPALSDLNFSVDEGEFIVLCGKSGSGKSTLLRLLKPALAPHGEQSGQILFDGYELKQMSQREQSKQIGFVCQNPEAGVVTDKVWHELAFVGESLGMEQNEIRNRVAEVASFFGISEWFYQKTCELSGGQKQILNLAAAMVTAPRVLILDEPTAALDPICSAEFVQMLAKINRELGTTIILCEQRLEAVLPLCDKALLLDKGRLQAFCPPRELGKILLEQGKGMFLAMPVPLRVWAAVNNSMACPITVGEGRLWLDQLARLQEFDQSLIPSHIKSAGQETLLELKEVWFRYQKNSTDILKGLSARVYRGEILGIVGANGIGKSTLLSLIAGLKEPVRGVIKTAGERIALMPQNPRQLLIKKSVAEELNEVFDGRQQFVQDKQKLLEKVISLCELSELLERHPYDLSGGEQQRLALAKVLLCRPRLLLLDEPTKSLDAEYKQKLGEILCRLQSEGVTIVLVSHDLEFCAGFCDRCALLFDGDIISEGSPRQFFAGKSFYTTAANRMARSLLPEAILPEDIISAFGGKLINPSDGHCDVDERFSCRKKDNIVELPKCAGAEVLITRQAARRRKLSARTKWSLFMLLAAIPLTVWVGDYYFDDRKYYFISSLILIEALLPFLLIFEDRSPQARELVLIAVLVALCVASRAALFMVPHFKPMLAMVIICGLCLGAESGFLIGVLAAFCSNIFFGQGPWTPWQMLAYGLIGFLSGVLYQKGLLSKNKIALCVFGGLTAVLLYGGIMNPASVLIYQSAPSWEMFVSAYALGLPLDLIHAAATVLFLWLLAVPMSEKLERLKIKYGLLE